MLSESYDSSHNVWKLLGAARSNVGSQSSGHLDIDFLAMHSTDYFFSSRYLGT